MTTGEQGDVRSINRYAELIQKTSNRFLQSSLIEVAKHVNSGCSEESDFSDVSVLSTSQLEHLDYAIQEVDTSTLSLIHYVEKYLGPTETEKK